MTVTLSIEELANFSSKLSGWYSQRANFVMERLPSLISDYHFSVGSTSLAGKVARLSEEFEKLNPKPDWRSLL